MSTDVVIMGLDAASFDLLGPWMEEGQLPNIKRIVDNGASGTMNSVIQPLSPAAWSSMITGVNPGKHGIYDWKLDERYVNSQDIKAPKLWDYLEEEGKDLGLMNMPITYPPVEVPGYMVTGILTPSTNKEFTYPPELKNKILENVGDYRIAEDEVYIEGKEELLLNDYHNILENKISVINYLFSQHHKDVNFYVLMVTDHIQHKFWKYMDPNHPSYKETSFKDSILSIYKRVDEFLGEFTEKMSSDTQLMLVSDHGAGGFHKSVCINEWLMEKGLLKLKRNPVTSGKLWMAKSNFVKKTYEFLNKVGLGKLGLLVPKSGRDALINSFLGLDDIDWNRTKAYSTGFMGKIFVNLKGRDEKGIVEPGDEYKELINYIKDELYKLEDPEDGEKIVDKVHFKEDLYSGPYVEDAPDIIFKMRNYSYVQSERIIAPSDEGLFTFSPYDDSGQHRLGGIFVGYGSKFRSINLDDLHITDVVPTLLYLLGGKIPKGVDGEVVKSAFTKDFLDENPIKTYDFKEKKKEQGEFTREDEEEIEERLKNLGYLG